MLDASRLVASPCCNPDLTLEQALEAYAALGFAKFEAFTSWCASALDVDADAATYAALASRHGMRFVSMHLPPVTTDLESSVERAVHAARFAKALGAGVVLYKAIDRPTYIAGAKPFLDAIDDLGVTPVLQNHHGSPISALGDFREVLEGIDDARMCALLEVGHFHAAGVAWAEAYDMLAGRIALVHIKDMQGTQSVPFGEGEVDLPHLFERLAQDDYPGDIVVEMEVADPENTLRYLGEALTYLDAHCLEREP